MLARRVVALAPDKTFGKLLTVALRAAGTTAEHIAEVSALTTDDLHSPLVVWHLDPDALPQLGPVLARASATTQFIMIVPKGTLVHLVDVMQRTDRIAGVLLAEAFAAHELTALVARTLIGDIFGLEKHVPWGTRVHAALVSDYQEKSLCIAQVSEFAEAMGVRRKYREAIEQCLDEMLMNALYDAPVDEEGRQIFAEIPIKTRLALRVEQKVIVQYACDGKSFALSVRDVFGTLERHTVLAYLHKCLHAEQQIDRKAGGAGLGLYMIANAASRVMFNVLPGVATECICAFNLLSAKVQLESFGFFQERIDAAGRLAGGPSQVLPHGPGHPVERRRLQSAPPVRPRVLVPSLAAAVCVLVLLIVVLARSNRNATASATIALSTTPAGATVEIAGRAVGATSESPLLLAGLRAHEAYPVVITRPGYATIRTVVVPNPGRTSLPITLEPTPNLVVVQSDPPGAKIEREGRKIGQTPAVLTDLPADAASKISLLHHGFRPAVVTIDANRTSAPLRTVTQSLELEPAFATLRLTSDPSGAAITVDGAPVGDQQTPASDVLVKANQEHTVSFQLAGRTPVTVKVTPPGGARNHAVVADLRASAPRKTGIDITGAAAGAFVSVSDQASCQKLVVPSTCLLPPGNYTITIQRAGERLTKTIAVTAEQRAQLRVTLGQRGRSATLQATTVTPAP